MRQDLRTIVVTVVALLLASLVQPLLPETITHIAPLPLINHPVVQFLFLAVVAFYVLSGMARWVRKLIWKPRRPFVTVTSRRLEPNHVDDEYEIEKFGVKWVVLCGRRVIPGDRYAHAEDPQCPDCDTELMTDEKPRRIRDDVKLWRCPGCGFTQHRPEAWLYDEKEAVAKEVESYVRNENS
jgi:predicted RNA-binding Zn-ribbon protein involved in translation (DUF1610 family)